MHILGNGYPAPAPEDGRDDVTVRRSLLAILDQGSCYGYQLRTEFERRTGALWPLNVGQIYHTLERLERDGLVERGDVDEHGHVYWRITPAGSGDVARWLSAPTARAPRDELAMKIAVAATLPGVRIAAVIAEQREDAERRASTLRVETAESGLPLARAVVLDAQLAAAEAELGWLDRVEERLAQHPEHTVALSLSADRPRRGRPAARERDA